ncbi:MAG: hypothetical protein H6741_02295 [Alphaproteobacteria bacterium]|nr:hypothetical protein [Alphaproteobacteria bacterium]MCB9791534.1 hypothetical protein [Alphaproteobacteria bacterium]
MKDPMDFLLDAYKAETEPPDAVVEAATARALAARRSPWPRRLGILGGLLFIGLTSTWLTTTPPPTSRALSSPDSSRALSLGAGVRAVFQGEGEARAEDGRLVLWWQVGALHLSAEDPDWPLAATTAEGRLSLNEGAFALERSALGSRFEMDAGQATLQCEGEAPRTLTAGQEAWCLPTTAAGWRARAQALSEAGAAATEVLSALDAGLDRPAPEPLRAELQAARVQALLALERVDEALAAAEDYLREPERPRAQALRRLAASVALQAGDCARALPHLQALASPSADEARWIDICTQEGS